MDHNVDDQEDDAVSGWTRLDKLPPRRYRPRDRQWLNWNEMEEVRLENPFLTFIFAAIQIIGIQNGQVNCWFQGSPAGLRLRYVPDSPDIPSTNSWA